MRLCAPTIALLTVTAAASSVLADNAALSGALARPLSPGAVALLGPLARNPAVVDRIGKAVQDSDASTRAAGARVASVRGLGPLAPLIAAALARETDADVAFEQMIALLVMASGHDAAAYDAALRIDGSSHRIIHWLVALGGAAPAAKLALDKNDRALWSMALNRAANEEGGLKVVPPDLLAASLRLDEPLTATLDHLALALPDAVPRTPALTSAISKLRKTLPRAEWPLALEFLVRLDGGKPHDRSATLREASEKRSYFVVLLSSSAHLRKKLTEEERNALGDESLGSLPPPDTAPSGPTTQLAVGFPRDYVRDTLAVSGCVSTREDLLAGTVRYARGGQPSEISVRADLVADPRCQAAAEALLGSYRVGRRMLRTSPGSGSALPAAGSETLLLIPVDPEALACRPPSLSGLTSTAVMAGLRTSLGAPERARYVSPVYPKEAKERRIAGRVVIEAEVSETGCVYEARIAQSAHPLLDVAALRAVSQWAWKPLLVKGSPIPFVYNLGVTFKLD
jgi:TonB family protein